MTWRCLAVLALLTLAGCATELPRPPPPDAAELAWAMRGADRVMATDAQPVDDDALLHVSPEMHRFALAATAHSYTTHQRLHALAAALGSPSGLALQYDPAATLTAEQAFQQHRVNCLSYTLLFVALARDVDVAASFNEVVVPPIWDLGDDQTLLLYRHVNARVDLDATMVDIVDVNGGEYDPGFEQHLIPDTTALAQFHNNRAVELRLGKQLDAALREQLRALTLLPEAEYLWVNLGELYLLLDDLRAARIAVEQALRLGGHGTSPLSLQAAAQVYERLGQPRLAAAFREQAQTFLESSPYYHYQLALAALRSSQDYREAYRQVGMAITLYPHEHRFYFLQAVILERLGDRPDADDSLKLAFDMASDPAQRERYRNKFARLTGG